MGDHRLFADFSTEELEQEIQRRHNQPPQRAKYMLWGKVDAYVVSIVEGIANTGNIPKDFEQTLAHLVIEAMYGESVWKWWNRKVNT